MAAVHEHRNRLVDFHARRDLTAEFQCVVDVAELRHLVPGYAAPEKARRGEVVGQLAP
jgi:hypothetical protein